jgi:hypothetical protein
MTDLQALLNAIDELPPDELDEVYRHIVLRRYQTDEDAVETTPEKEAVLLASLGDALDEDGNIDFSKLDTHILDLDTLSEENDA